MTVSGRSGATTRAQQRDPYTSLCDIRYIQPHHLRANARFPRSMPEGWVVRIRDVAGRTRHTSPTAPASLVAGPRTSVMRLANPIGIPTAGAFHSGIHVSTSLARGQARVRNRGQQKPRLGGRGFKVTNLRRSSLPVVACNGSENSRCALSALQSIRELS